jgi:hypothetical protein
MYMEKVIKGLKTCSQKTVLYVCGQCPYNNDDNDTYDCTQALSEDALDLLKEQDSGWISVNDRLPELNQDVLVYAVGKIDGFIEKHAIEICNRFIQRIFPSSPGQEMWSSPYQYFHTDYEITHWMPLPEPPKEGR